MRSKEAPEQADGPSVLDILLDPQKVPEPSPRADPTHGAEPGSTESAERRPTRFQRAVPRQPVDWVARFRFRNDPSGQWYECRVSDISTAGAGLKLFGIEPEKLEGRKIDVQVQLSGEVRNIVTGMKKDVRIGVEFLDLGGDSAKFVDSLKRTNTRW